MLPLDALNLVAPMTFRSGSLALTVWPTTIMPPVPEIGPHDQGQPEGSCSGPVSPSSHSGVTRWHSEKPAQSGPHHTHAFITNLHDQKGQYSPPDVRSRPGTYHATVFPFWAPTGHRRVCRSWQCWLSLLLFLLASGLHGSSSR